MAPDNDDDGNFPWLRFFVGFVGMVVVVVWISRLLFGILRGFGMVSIAASILGIVFGAFVIGVAMADSMRPSEERTLYIDTLEGGTVAAVTVELSLLSFVTIVDRTPTTLAGSESSPEGLFVVPETILFPVGINPSVVVYTAVGSVLIVALCRGLAQHAPNQPREQYYILSRIGILVSLLFSLFLLFLTDLNIPGGIEIEGRRLRSTPTTGLIMFVIMWGLIALPASVYTFTLLPDWVKDAGLDTNTQREFLKDYIDSNWRRARVITTLTLTGAVGTALSFVFGRATPNFFFVLAIVGSVIIGPVGVVWFLMRRIREAEKELRPSPR